MSKTTVSYACPQCGCETDKATITHDYTPTEADLKLRLLVKSEARNQRLHCPCGYVYTWFSARQVTFKDRT